MKERLDVLMVNRGLAQSREKAKAIIMSGIVYVSFDDKGAWQIAVAKEMKAAGLDVDLNKLA